VLWCGGLVSREFVCDVTARGCGNLSYEFPFSIKSFKMLCAVAALTCDVPEYFDAVHPAVYHHIVT
jgi:hypothetical protein